MIYGIEAFAVSSGGVIIGFVSVRAREPMSGTGRAGKNKWQLTFLWHLAASRRGITESERERKREREIKRRKERDRSGMLRCSGASGRGPQHTQRGGGVRNGACAPLD